MLIWVQQCEGDVYGGGWKRLHPGGEGPQTTGSKGFTGGLQTGGLQSPATDLGSISALTCSLHRVGAYIRGAYSLERPNLDILANLPVLYVVG